MSDQLSALRLFVRVAATGSFSQAAREHNLTQPTASRTIALLEEQLGNTLFVRTTRATTLTEAGAEYLARIKPILEALDEADHAVRETGELRGKLRIGLPSTLASRVVVPILSGFVDQHPKLRVELVVDDRRQDLISENVDVVLRFGKLQDSSAIARSVGRWPLVAAASPGYIERNGLPSTPSDLSQHRFVVGGPAAGTGITFSKDGVDIPVEINGNVVVTGAEAAVAAGVAGLGVVAASLPSMEREILQGQLVRLFSDWDIGEITAHALFPSGQAPKPSARAFVEFFVGAISAQRGKSSVKPGETPASGV
ncbi:LysR family transcriptional regulator [Rhizobium sp. S152]|uniref:LysR family transcriptional regulator n=1 Tax=Rhizobium sp. S152 TaxID=3055038 RepID=UPI0025A931E8|nr:LysR family transcriptional regulator [Rhizobium sp. S152]MDM9628544.1 LysR family transcriptional regulator [Rhizobium sp. S152]